MMPSLLRIDVMQKFKIDNFNNQMYGVPFPRYESLNIEECANFYYQICKRFKISKDTVALELVSKLSGCQEVIHNHINANNENFNLIDLLKVIDIESNKSVFINWYQFDEIDMIALLDISEYFHDIWYPGSDDIDIFDSSLSWILSITHYGNIQFLKFS